MRDNQWLLQITKELWHNHFTDILVKNRILVLFSRRNKRVMGSIKYDRQTKTTYLRINGYFKNEQIPLQVIQATIAHEIAHYAHGFSAPTKKLYRYPHQGGIIREELTQRDLAALEKKSKAWLKKNWLDFLKNQKHKKIWRLSFDIYYLCISAK